MENPIKMDDNWAYRTVPPIYGNPDIVTLTIHTLFCLINVTARFSFAEFTHAWME